MQKLTFWLVWAFVFSLPWERVIAFPLIGSVSRLIGIIAIVVGVLTISASGRVRKPSLPLWIAVGFTLFAALSFSWTISYAATIDQMSTYLQLLGLVLLVWNFAKRPEQLNSLMVAFCLGAYVAFADTLEKVMTGVQPEELRYAATNFNPNEFGLTLALGVPIAWHLFLTRRGITRLMTGAYFPLAIVVILLTASRGAFLATIVALSIIPVTTGATSVRRFLTIAALLVVAVSSAAVIVPRSSWTRILTAQEQISSGSVGGRGPIWSAGRSVFLDRPLLGAGAGAFEQAVQPLIGPQAAHNVLLAILVEQGIVGIAMFVALLTACVFLLKTLPPPGRRLWAVTGLTWLVSTMSADFHHIKVTWFLFALIAAQASATDNRTSTARRPRLTMKPDTAARPLIGDAVDPNVAIEVQPFFLRRDTRVWNCRVR